MKWRVELSGDNGDLEELSKSLNSDKLRILRESEKYFLTSSGFNGITEADIVLKKSEEILTFINAGSKVIQNLQKPINLSGIESLNENAKNTQYIFPESIVSVEGVGRPTVLRDSKVEETYIYKELPNLVLLATQDKHVAEVLNYLNTGSNEIATLYKIYEIIRCDVGGKKSIRDKGWDSRNQIELFTRTVQSPDAIGDKARHGVQKGQPPKNPMSLNQATSFILHLVKCWLYSKIPN